MTLFECLPIYLRTCVLTLVEEMHRTNHYTLKNLSKQKIDRFALKKVAQKSTPGVAALLSCLTVRMFFFLQ